MHTVNSLIQKNHIAHIEKELSEKIIHTMGGLGCEYQGKRYPTKKVEVRDLSGAGDTFISAFVVKFLETDDVGDSIKYANQCASKVVSHRGVTTI